jgi:CPA2 family monovalent cation:H+ antiporter-2
MEGVLLQATIYLMAMVIAVPLSVRLGLGSVLGYLIAGIAIGPILGLVGSETQDLQHYAEFGVVLMLFLIGLELDPKTLWNMRKKLVGVGGAQVLLSTLRHRGGRLCDGAAAGHGARRRHHAGAVVHRDRADDADRKGPDADRRGAILLLRPLTQDIAVIPALALLPLLAVQASVAISEDGSIQRGHADDGHHSMSLVEGLPAWGVTLVTLGAVVAVILAGRYLSPILFRYIHLSRLREMYTAVALVIVVGIAFLMILVGLSPALGAFVAGVVLANSEFRHELEADIEPFKGLLLGLFFITVGAGINFGTFFGNPFLILGLTLGMMLLKGAILFAIALVFRLKGRDKWLFTLSLAQAGEFGFVLIAFGLQQAVFPVRIGEILLLVIALSMLLTPLAFIASDWIAGRLTQDHTAEEGEADEIDEQASIIIAGIGRFGQVVNRMVQASGYRTVVLDNDLATIQLMRRFGFKGYFGDPSRPELLKAAGLETAKVLVVAVDDKQASSTWCAMPGASGPTSRSPRAPMTGCTSMSLRCGRRSHRARDVRFKPARGALCAGGYGPDGLRGAPDGNRLLPARSPQPSGTGRALATRRRADRQRRLCRQGAGAQQQPRNRASGAARRGRRHAANRLEAARRCRCAQRIATVGVEPPQTPGRGLAL